MIELLLFAAITLLLIRHRFFWSARDGEVEPPKFMAHRGIKIHSPENTISAYIEAVDRGFQAIEMDIVQTKDGEIVCSHNFDLERETNGLGWIHRTLLSDLNDVQTGVYSHRDNPQTLPRLLDALDEIPENIFLNIEIKTHRLLDLSTAKSLTVLIKSGKIKHQFILSSFSPLVVVYFRLFNPVVPMGFLLQDKAWLWLTHWIHPDFLHPRADLVDEEMMHLCRKHNVPLNLWTVNSLPAIKWCQQNKIAGIITDNPKALHV